VALYAFDGTWNSAKANEDPNYQNTNVFRFHRAYERHSTTNNLYVPGVGTRFDLVGRVLGGAFGLGELRRLNETYDALCRNWAAGDDVIDIVGFSRGAATTLDFCHIIQGRGIRAPGSDTVVEAHPRIRFLGVWDIVAAFGLANLGLTDLNIGHHLSLPKANLQYAFHALALDERRPSFLPTRLHGACEVWFRGVHSDIGGGNGNRGLNDITLEWMLHKAHAAGLPITLDDIAVLRPDPRTVPSHNTPLDMDIRLVAGVDHRHYTVAPVAGYRNPPATCAIEREDDERRALEVGPNGVGLLSQAFRDRVVVLASVAEAEAKAHDMSFDGLREGLLTLLEGRIPLVTDDARLLEARTNVIRVMDSVIRHAKAHQYHALNEFFLTEALFELRPIFPFTDA
jgi:hypothetical protein